jgi:hypothetical protein
MNLIDSSKNGNGSLPTSTVEPSDTASTQRETESPESGVETPLRFATRADVKTPEGISKSKLLLLGGGLAVAVLFFVFTAVVGKSPKKTAVKQTVQTQQAKQQSASSQKGSVTPLMDTPRIPPPDNSSGQLGPSDIRRTRAIGNPPPDVKPVAAKPTSPGICTRTVPQTGRFCCGTGGRRRGQHSSASSVFRPAPPGPITSWGSLSERSGSRRSMGLGASRCWYQ